MVKIELKIPKFRSFLGSFSLECGTCFVLWSSVIAGVFTMLAPTNSIKISAAAPSAPFFEEMSKASEAWNQFLGPASSFMPKVMNFGKINGEISLGVSWINIPVGFITVLVSALGLYGVYELENTSYLFPYVVWSFMCAIIALLAILLSPVGVFLFVSVLLLCNIGFFLYCVITVYNYYMMSKLVHRERSPDKSFGTV